MSAAIHISLAAEKVFEIGGLSVTNSMIASTIGSLIILGLFLAAAKSVSLQPKGRLAMAVESVVEMILNLIEQVTLDREKAQKFFPILMTFFMFILVNNWLGLLPGFGSITIKTAEGAVPLFRGATADLNTTLALAAMSVVATHIYSIQKLGLFRHLGKYFTWNPVMTFVGILELVSDLSKAISFSFRLFGNIFAGEVLLVVISFLAPVMAPLPFFGLELFVGLVQALVFTMLTLVFLEIATAAHGHEEAHEAAH